MPYESGGSISWLL